MGLYRKKPVIVQAFQMTKERRTDNREWPEWFNRAWNGNRGEEGSVWPREEGTANGMLCVGTLEAAQLISWNDYIIQGVKGELYPCKPDIFEQTYDKAD